MKYFYLDDIRSVAAWQLVQPGNAATENTLKLWVGRMSDVALSSLEDEVEFFFKTGFVGIQMSEILSGLDTDSLRLAA